MKLKDVFEKSVQFFKDKNIESARLDAELLLSHVLKIERLQIYLKYEQPLTENEIGVCREAVRRRGQGEPVAYITGEKGFYGQIFSVGEGVLIPRPETEMIVEEALKFIQDKKIETPQVLDLGAGSGCIGFSILKNSPHAKLISLEKSEKAFRYLKSNQESLQLRERSELILSDVMKWSAENRKFDIIVANPPYISENDLQIQSEVKKYEPREALFALNNGLADVLAWSSRYKNNLKPQSLMLFEIGYQQAAACKLYFESTASFSSVEILKDLSGLDRVIKAKNNK